MIYKKTEQRIAQYVTFLERVKYRSLINVLDWESTVTKQIFRRPPDNHQTNWTPVPSFPYSYGNNDETWWFRTILHLPDSLENQDIYLELDTQTDTLIFVNDIPAGAVNPFHGKFRLTPYYVPGITLKIDMEVWTGHTFPGYHPFDGPRVLTTVAHRQKSYPLVVQAPRLLIKENEIYNLYYDAVVLFETAKLQNENSLLRSQITKQLHKALLNIDFMSEQETLSLQAKFAREQIQPLLSLENGSLAPRIHSTGNAHLDHAWLWPISETSRKCARTCANMVAFTEEYPEFHYLHSQPAQMVDLRNNYPDVFNRVIDAVERGQWEPNGGMWVEADCNLTGGESLIRQFLLGHKTTEELFGYRGDTLWLPDVFGYNGSLPQIMKGCGIEYFVTSKISWNDTTQFPFDLFLWKGIDGTSIPTHFITTAYEGRNTPAETSKAWNKIQHKDIQRSIFRSIGEGDGGGGTLRSDLESMRRMKNLQGIPENSWSRLTDAMESIFSESSDLPICSGELYLELHRGTYTTQAQIKRYNRKLEYSLRELELKEVRLFLSGGSEEKRAAEKLHQVIGNCWKDLLTLQFHDILPGTSVRKVNQEALETYEKMTKQVCSASEEADSVLYGTGEVLIFGNSLPFKRTTVIELPLNKNYPGLLQTVQQIRNFKDEPVLLTIAELEGLALNVSGECITTEGLEEIPFKLENDSLETPWYYLNFDSLGGISQMILKESERTVSIDGSSMNAFFMVEDFPVNWDAWDIEDDYRLKEIRDGKLLSREVISIGTVCLQIRQKLSIGKASVLTQDLFFYAHTARIDFQTHVDWQEEHQLLRVNFPTSVTSGKGFFDIPFGYAERDIHRNRPEDRARFEVCAHKWALIKDARLSTVILSDCKYGYRVESGLLSLTLLRAPTAPDPLADRGEHRFSYAFLPSDNIDIRNVIREGWDLNIPAEVGNGSLSSSQSDPLFRFSSDDVMVESIKVSEDRKGVILRICEITGAPLRLNISPSSTSGFIGVYITNMLEELVEDKGLKDNEVSVSMHGFEVKTLKFLLK